MEGEQGPRPAKHLFVLSGATATGKTDMAIRLAEHFGTQIISADSRQFYREMSIGTAKPTAEQLARVKHHFVDSLSIFEEYSVGDFEEDVLELLADKFQRRDVMMMAGGSGLYIRAVCEGLDQFPEVPIKVRAKWEKHFKEKGLAYLQAELRHTDPAYYAEVDTANPHRLIRALSVSEVSGQPFSVFRTRQKAERPFQIHHVNLHIKRELLNARINERVDKMLAQGLLEEVRELYPNRHLNALQTVGYQELFDFLSEKLDYEEAVEAIKRNTRRYAKRQITWFAKMDDLVPFDAADYEGVRAYFEARLAE